MQETTVEWLPEMKDLKKDYRKTYWILKRSLKSTKEDGTHPDEKMIKEAISDIHFAITWIHTGKMPGNKRGIERRAAYQREKLMDPLRMQAYVQRNSAGSPANITDWQRFQIEDALSRLSDRERECYVLAHGECFSLSEIGEMLNISKSSVEEYVTRAQKKISADLTNSLFLLE